MDSSLRWNDVIGLIEVFPVVILVRPQMGENIGMVARAMLNCGATDLRIVAPRDGWPNAAAYPPAAGADSVLDKATVYNTVDEAIADLKQVYAATVRPRHFQVPVYTPQEAAALPLEKTGILFGPENNGLHNDDLVAVNAIITVPLNPAFCSLNLAQAVLLIIHAFVNADLSEKAVPNIVTAEKREIQQLTSNLDSYLCNANYYRPAEKKQAMQRSLNNLFYNAHLTSQQVKTLQGVFKTLYKTGDST